MQAKKISYNEIRPPMVMKGSSRIVTTLDVAEWTEEASAANLLSIMTEKDSTGKKIDTSQRVSYLYSTPISCPIYITSSALSKYAKIKNIMSIIGLVCIYLISVVSASAIFCPSWEYFKTEFIYSASFLCLTLILGVLTGIAIIASVLRLMSKNKKIRYYESHLTPLEQMVLLDESVSERKISHVFAPILSSIVCAIGIALFIVGIIWACRMSSTLAPFSTLFILSGLFFSIVGILVDIFIINAIEDSIKAKFIIWSIANSAKYIPFDVLMKESTIPSNPPEYPHPPAYESLYENGDVHQNDAIGDNDYSDVHQKGAIGDNDYSDVHQKGAIGDNDYSDVHQKGAIGDNDYSDVHQKGAIGDKLGSVSVDIIDQSLQQRC